MRYDMRRSWGVRRWSGGGEARFETSVEVIRLPEAANEDDAGDNAAFRAETVNLAGNEITNFLDDRFEDVFDLFGAHDEEARVKSCLLVIWEAGKTGGMSAQSLHEAHRIWDLRYVDLLVLILIEVALDELLKVPEPHLPRLSLLLFHLVEPRLTQSTSHMLLKTIVEKRAAA